jgi:hypothetical protein
VNIVVTIVAVADVVLRSKAWYGKLRGRLYSQEYFNVVMKCCCPLLPCPMCISSFDTYVFTCVSKAVVSILAAIDAATNGVITTGAAAMVNALTTAIGPCIRRRGRASGIVFSGFERVCGGGGV